MTFVQWRLLNNVCKKQPQTEWQRMAVKVGLCHIPMQSMQSPCCVCMCVCACVCMCVAVEGVTFSLVYRPVTIS